MKVFGLLSTITLIFLSLSLNGCVFHIVSNAPEKFERAVELSSDFDSGSTLSVETSNGAIFVTGIDDETCHVDAAITAHSFSPEEAQALAEQTQIRLESTSEGLRLVIDRPRKKQRESIDVSYEIQVPRQTRLSLRSSNGKVIVEQIEKEINAATSNGKIEITSAEANITAHTSNGAIIIRQTSAPSMDLHTSNGSIRCEDISGNLTASTSNGSVRIRYLPDAKPEKVRITTSNGGIDLLTPKDYSAQIDAATSNGTINASVPIEGHKDSKRIKGVIRQGDGQLYLRTSNSSIAVN